MQIDSEFPKAERRDEQRARSSRRLRVAREHAAEAILVVDRAIAAAHRKAVNL